MSQSLSDAMASFSPKLPLAVAYSGGADSTALLLACCRRWPGQVVAVHIHHGLQPAADAFVGHCEAVCLQWKVPLIVRRVDARHARGASPEDSARRARYQELHAAVHGEAGQVLYPSVAIAQHADDQVETMLLALSRGAGLPGLAAMPGRRERRGVVYHRPLLAVSASCIRMWLAGQNATHIEDPSNSNQDLTRNRIRARVLPSLDACFPQFRETFARSARHAAQAQQLLDEIAGEDMAHIAAASGLLITSLRALSEARQANLLRHWLKSVHGATASAAQLGEWQRQLAACATRGHRIEIKVANGFVRRNGAHVTWYNGAPDPTASD